MIPTKEQVSLILGHSDGEAFAYPSSPSSDFCLLISRSETLILYRVFSYPPDKLTVDKQKRLHEERQKEPVTVLLLPHIKMDAMDPLEVN